MTSAPKPIERIPVGVVPKGARSELHVDLVRYADGWHVQTRMWSIGQRGEMEPARRGWTLPAAAAAKIAGVLTAASYEVDTRRLIR